MPESPAAGRRAALPFILIVVFIDVLGIGLAMPVLPMLIGDYTPSRELQSYWYGVLVVVYGLMQFFCAPLLAHQPACHARQRLSRSTNSFLNLATLGATTNWQ